MVPYASEDPTFAPFLVLWIAVAIYNRAYFDALIDTCVITTQAGIEYRRPEFSTFAPWSQIKALKRTPVLSVPGVRYYLILDSPTVLYTKWLGTAYRLQLMHILLGLEKRIPLGKIWQAHEELEAEIRIHVPGLHFAASRGKAVGQE